MFLAHFMVAESKLIVVGGSNMVLSSLFVLMFFCNVTGLVPYVVSVSSHLVFRLCFGVRV